MKTVLQIKSSKLEIISANRRYKKKADNKNKYGDYGNNKIDFRDCDCM